VGSKENSSEGGGDVSPVFVTWRQRGTGGTEKWEINFRNSATLGNKTIENKPRVGGNVIRIKGKAVGDKVIPFRSER